MATYLQVWVHDYYMCADWLVLGSVSVPPLLNLKGKGKRGFV